MSLKSGLRKVCHKVVFLGMALLLGCQTPPKTSVHEEQGTFFKNASHEDLQRLKRLVEDPETILLDTREAREFFLSQVPGSRLANYREFISLKSEDDLFVVPQHESVVRRWALWGINPQTAVVILGKGTKGQGEQAWWAWVLSSFGVKDVHLANIEDFRQRVAAVPEGSAPKKNKAFWKANGILNEVTLPKLKKILAKEKAYKAAQFVYIGDTNIQLPTKVKKINWKKFYNANTTVRSEVVEELQSLGLKKETGIILFGDKGLSSGAVAYALEKLGYINVKNYPGSYLLIKTLF